MAADTSASACQILCGHTRVTGSSAGEGVRRFASRRARVAPPRLVLSTLSEDGFIDLEVFREDASESIENLPLVRVFEFLQQHL